MIDPMKPDIQLLIKIGSALVHADEMVETNFKNLDFDLPAFKTVFDEDVKNWIKEMGAFLPCKRSTK